MARKKPIARKIRGAALLLVALIVAASLVSCDEEQPKSDTADKLSVPTAVVTPETTDQLPTATESGSDLGATESDSSENLPALTGTIPEPSPPAQYEISVEATLDAATNNVEAQITTSIPGSIEVIAELSLAGQAPDELWIGIDKRVILQDGRGSVTLDGSELPSGDYDVEVSFYPRSGFKDDISRATGIEQPIHSRTAVSIVGSGESAKCP